MVPGASHRQGSIGVCLSGSFLRFRFLLCSDIFVICFFVPLPKLLCFSNSEVELKIRASRSNAKQVYVEALFRGFFVHVCSCWRSWAPSWLILALLGPILWPSCSKMSPKWPNIDKHSAKMGQNSSPRAPKSSKNLEKPIKTSGF